MMSYRQTCLFSALIFDILDTSYLSLIELFKTFSCQRNQIKYDENICNKIHLQYSVQARSPHAKRLWFNDVTQFSVLLGLLKLIFRLCLVQCISKYDKHTKFLIELYTGGFIKTRKAGTSPSYQHHPTRLLFSSLFIQVKQVRIPCLLLMFILLHQILMKSLL